VPSRTVTSQEDEMDHKHTPGPWRLSAAGMVEMGDPSSRLSFWAGLGYGGQLPNPSGQDPHAETEANAHLIVAAPDLLEALEKIERALGGASNGTMEAEAAACARAAIAKACDA
jgi:hypothetical protein